MPTIAQAKFMGSELTKAGNVVTEPKVNAVVTTFMIPRNAPPTAPPMICASQTFLFLEFSGFYILFSFQGSLLLSHRQLIYIIISN